MKRIHSTGSLLLVLSMYFFVPTGSSAQVTNVEDLQLYSVEPLYAIHSVVEFGEYHYALTNNGLFVLDADKQPVRHIGRPDGLQNTNLVAFAQTQDELFIFSGALNRNCFPSPGINTVQMHKVEGDRLNPVITFGYWGSPHTAVDKFGNVWIFVYPEGYGAVYRYDGSGINETPVFVRVDRMGLDTELQQIVIRYYTELSPDGEVHTVTFNGEEFVPFPGFNFNASPPPTDPVPAEIMPILRAHYPELPVNGTVSKIREAPDGSIWYLDGNLGYICLARTKDTQNIHPDLDETSNTYAKDTVEPYQHPLSYMPEIWYFEQTLKRRMSGGIESHASWLADQFDNRLHIQDFELNANGDPVLGFQHTTSLHTMDNPVPQFWTYTNYITDLHFWDHPTIDGYWDYSVSRLNDGKMLLHSNRIIAVLKNNRVSLFELPPGFGRILNSPGLQQINSDQYRLFSQFFGAFQPYAAYAIDITVNESGDIEIHEPFEIDPSEIALSAVDDRGYTWYTTDTGVRAEHPEYDTIETELGYPVFSDYTDIMVRSNGEIWVAKCSDGVYVLDPDGVEIAHLTQPNGLSSNCPLSISEGASGNIYIGSNFGYTIAGDPSLIAGEPMPEKTPTSIHENNPELVNRIHLEQNYPNPFNPSTTIRFRLPEAQHVRLEIMDITGRLVTVLADQIFAAGEHQAIFDAGHAGLSSGVYLYAIREKGLITTRKMLLIK